MEEIKKIEKPFVLWTVKNEDYKLKLTTMDIQIIEEKYNTSILEVFMGDIPSLKKQLDIVHLAMQKFQHGITREKVNYIFDDYLDDGGNIQDFYTSVFMNIAVVSGFFTEALKKSIQESMSEMSKID